MTLSAGTRLGSYEILAPLGAGGMGEVYRRLRLLGICACGAAALGSAKGLDRAPDPSLRSGSRGANLLPRFARETFRAASDRRVWRESDVVG